MKDNGSNARVTEEVMAKDKKKPVQQDEKMPAEAHETVEQNSAENRAENSEDNGGVTLSKDEFVRAKAEIERMNSEIRRVLRPGGILYVNDFLLFTDDRNKARYEKFNNKYGEYGVFELPEGAVCRHHDE